MKEKIKTIFRIIIFILFLLFYPMLLFKVVREEEFGNILDGIGTILWGVTLIVGMVTVFVWVLKKLGFIKVILKVE